MRDFLRLKFSFELASRAKSENMAIPTAVLALLTSLAVPTAVLSSLAVSAVGLAQPDRLPAAAPARCSRPVQIY